MLTYDQTGDTADTSMENFSTCEDFDTSHKPKFYTLDNRSIVIMSPECKFYFNGKLRAKVLAGKIEVYGYVLDPDNVNPVEIYSPRGSSLVGIQTICSGSIEANTELDQRLIAEGINSTVATHLKAEYDRGPVGQAVVIFESLENILTKFLDAYCPFKLFPKNEETTSYQNTHPRKAEKILRVNFQFDQVGKQLQSCGNWQSDVLKKLKRRTSVGRLLIAGGKGVGKSTTLRHFVNELLPEEKEVVLVDLDPGQPEFTPSGCISINLISQPLMGPNFTHLKTPYHQVYIGDVNVVRCIPRYVTAIRKLFEFLDRSERLQNLIVVVNTMGFCTGIGWDLMMYVIKLAQPTTVLQIVSDQAKNNFPNVLNSDVVNRQKPSRFTLDDIQSIWKHRSKYEFHVVASLAETKAKFGDFWEMEPRQRRDVSLLAYLSQIIRQDEEDSSFLFKPFPRINDVVPYAVATSTLSIALTRSVVQPNHIMAAINATVVALCGIDKTGNDDTSTDIDPQILIRTPIPTCYGFGIVRGVDIEKGKIYLNTPLSLNQLKFVNCLVGVVPVPTILLLSDSCDTPYIHFGASSNELPTNREPHRGFVRMRPRHSSA